MKTYEGKTLDDVIQHACQDLGITPDELTYEIIEEKKEVEPIVHKLIERANFYGGRDNISAIVVMQD